MKKLGLFLLVALLLAGCADGNAQITNSKEEILKVGSTTITRGDVYDLMMAQDSSYFVLKDAQKVIFDQEIEVTDEMKKDAEEMLGQYEQLYGDNFESSLKNSGFETPEQFLNESLIPSVQYAELIKKYVSEHYDTLSTQYMPRQVIILDFTSEEEAKAALADLEAGVEATTVAETHKSTTKNVEPMIVTTATTQNYAANIQAYLQSIVAPGLSPVISNADSGKYTVIQTLSCNPEEIKEAAIESISNIDTISDEAMAHYFDQYQLKFYDREIYDQFKNNYNYVD